MKNMTIALIASLSLLAVPTGSAAPGDVMQVFECDTILGNGVFASSDVEGVNIGGCEHGTVDTTGDVDYDAPRDCELQYDENGDFFADGPVEDEAEAGWFLVSFCDAGVISAHLTVKILEQ